tara:strand:+ start:428 stop:622 length:195 start_codon:yes stop_codon:yes gene_type:complete
MSALEVLQDLQKEVNDYCDPNKKVVEMIARFIDLEVGLEVQAVEFRAQMSYEIEQRASAVTSHE